MLIVVSQVVVDLCMLAQISVPGIWNLGGFISTSEGPNTFLSESPRCLQNYPNNPTKGLLYVDVIW